MERTIFLPIFHYYSYVEDMEFNYELSKHPVENINVKEACYEFAFDAMRLESVTGEIYYVYMTVDEYNIFMKSYFSNNTLWLNKVGIREKDLQDEDNFIYEKFVIPMNKKIEFSVIG